MFYFKELYFRLFFLIISFLLIGTCLHFYKEILINIIILPLYLTSVLNNDCFFIYTNPTEVLTSVINVYLIIFFISVGPYMFWSFTDFIKSSLKQKEFNFIHNLLKVFIFLIIINILFFFLFFPIIWLFFDSFSNSYTKNLNINQELKIEEYIIYCFNYNYLLNIFILSFLVSNYLLIYLGITKFIKYKKLHVLINLVTATIISPPDVLSQIVLFSFLQFFLELLNIFLIYQKKYLIRH